MDSTMNVTPKQIETFEYVWKELLKQKINIIYTISQEKNENFKELLQEFVQEAFQHIELWKDNYIIDTDLEEENKLDISLSENKCSFSESKKEECNHLKPISIKKFKFKKKK